MYPRADLPDFHYLRASTFEEVFRLFDEDRETVSLMLGGTELMRHLRHGEASPKIILDIKHLPTMQDAVFDERTGLTLGAAVTMNQIARHPAIRGHYPLLAEAAGSVGSQAIRNRATVGGNLCNASPCADIAPPVLVLEGRIVLRGPTGAREVPADEFFRGPGQTAIRTNEVMTTIHIPKPQSSSVGRYLKLSRSTVENVSIAGVAVLGFPDQAAPSGYRFKIALGAVAPTPVCARAAERFLAGCLLDEGTLMTAAEKATEAVEAIDDERASAAYRKAMVNTLALRGLHEVWEKLNERQAKPSARAI